MTVRVSLEQSGFHEELAGGGSPLADPGLEMEQAPILAVPPILHMRLEHACIYIYIYIYMCVYIQYIYVHMCMHIFMHIHM